MAMALFFLYLLPAFLNLEAIKNQISQQLQRRYQIEVKVGRLELQFVPRFIVNLKDVQVKKSENSFYANQVTILPHWAALLRSKFEANLYCQGWKTRIFLSFQEKKGPPANWEKISQKLFKPIFIKKIRALNGHLEVVAKKDRVDFHFFEINASLEGKQILLTASFNSSFLEYGNLDLRAHQTGGIEGRLKAKAVKWDKWPLLFAKRLILEEKRDIEGRANLDITFHYVPKEEANLGFSLFFPYIRFKPQNLVLNDGMVQGTFSKRGKRLELRLIRVEIKHPQLEGRGCFIWQDGEKIGYKFWAEHLNISEIRPYALKILPEKKITPKIFQILVAGQIRHFSISHFARDIATFKKAKTLKINAVADGVTVNIPGANLILSQAKGKVAVKNLTLYGQGIQGRVENAKIKNGQVTICLKKKPGQVRVETGFESPLKTGLGLIKHFVKDEGLNQEFQLITSARGMVKGNLLLRGTHHHVRVEIKGQIQGAKITYKRLPYDLKIKKADFCYKSSHIGFQSLNLGLNHSFINDAQGEIDFSNPKDIHIRVSHLFALFNLKEIYPWLKRQSFGRSIGHVLEIGQGLLAIDNGQLSLSVCKKEGRLQIDNLTYQLPFDFKKGIIAFSFLPEALYLKTGEGEFLTNKIKFSEVRGKTQTGQEPFHLNGEVIGLFSKRPVVNLAGRAEIKTTLFRNWIYKIAHLPSELKIKIPLKIRAFRLHLGPKKASFEGNLIYQDVGLKVNVYKTARGLFLQKFEIKDPFQRGVVSFDYFNPFLETEQKIKFFIKGEITEGLLNKILVKNPYPYFRVSGDMKGVINLTNLNKSHIKGRLWAKGLKNIMSSWLSTLNPELNLKEVKLFADDKVIKVQKIEAVYKHNQVVAEGRVEFKPLAVFILGDCYSPFLDIEELESLFSTHKSEGQASKMPLFSQWALKGKMNFMVDGLKYRGLNLNDLSGMLLFNGPSNIKVDVQKAHYCDLSLKGRVELNHGKLRISSSFRAHKAQLETLMKCLIKKNHLLEGTYNLAGYFTAEGYSHPLKEKSKGKIFFHSSQGRIYKLTLMAKLFSVLNVIGIFKGHLPDLGKEGFAYQDFEIKGELRNGDLKINSLIIDSPSMKIVGQGKIKIPEFTANLTILVAPLRTIDIILKNIPILGKILTGKSGTFISVPVKIKGPLQDPEVHILSVKTIGKGILNLMERVVTFPVQIFVPE